MCNWFNKWIVVVAIALNLLATAAIAAFGEFCRFPAALKRSGAVQHMDPFERPLAHLSRQRIVMRHSFADAKSSQKAPNQTDRKCASSRLRLTAFSSGYKLGFALLV